MQHYIPRIRAPYDYCKSQSTKVTTAVCIGRICLRRLLLDGEHPRERRLAGTCILTAPIITVPMRPGCAVHLPPPRLDGRYTCVLDFIRAWHAHYGRRVFCSAKAIPLSWHEKARNIPSLVLRQTNIAGCIRHRTEHSLRLGKLMRPYLLSMADPACNSLMNRRAAGTNLLHTR